MGDIDTLTKPGGLIMHSVLIYEYTVYNCPIPNCELKRVWAYNT